MKLVLRRVEYGSNYTIGRLYINDSPTPECFTLEDIVRNNGVKVFGETAIPAGEYKVVVDFSEHFGKLLPHVLDVPMFAGIRIHSGNTDRDTEGCILVGQEWPGGDMIYKSRFAFDHLFPQIQEALKKEEVTLEIVNT